MVYTYSMRRWWRAQGKMLIAGSWKGTVLIEGIKTWRENLLITYLTYSLRLRPYSLVSGLLMAGNRPLASISMKGEKVRDLRCLIRPAVRSEGILSRLLWAALFKAKPLIHLKPRTIISNLLLNLANSTTSIRYL